MKTKQNLFSNQKITCRKIILSLFTWGLLFFGQTVLAQSVYKVSPNSSIKVIGTSNLHDWDMKANSFICEGNFDIKGSQLMDVKSLSFTLPITNLKSKESLMDSRAYKALKAEEFNKITFKLTSATVVAAQKLIKATGNLTIGGVTNLVTLNANYTLNADNSLTCKGSKDLKMSDFKIKAPVFMLGALKTGDAITIDYMLNLKN